MKTCGPEVGGAVAPSDAAEKKAHNGCKTRPTFT